MLRFIIICFFVIGLRAEFLGEVELYKDEVKTFNVFVENTTKTLDFRWTLYKDSVLIVHLKYDNMPHQFTLYKEKSNSAKVYLSNINTNNYHNENPYFILYFVDFDNNMKKAKFRYYFFRFSNNVEVVEFGG